MKLYSLAIQLLSTAFTATAASSSSLSVAEALAKKKYDNHRDIDGAAAATSRAVPSPSRDLVSIHTTSTSKSSKSSSYCPPEPTPDVQCGSTYVDSTVILGQNLLCNENITEADGSFNAALRLVGKGAVLDCQGYTISQTTVNIDGIDKGSAAALDCPIIPSNSTERLRMKRECGLFYLEGVLLEDGATMRSCNIKKFYIGSELRDGGKIENSGFSLNGRGVQIANLAANTMSKITNSELYNNYAGLSVFQENADDAKVMIEDVTANNNKFIGMYLTGTGITVNNANIGNNDVAGLLISSNAANNEITLDGDITLTNNYYGFDTTSDAQGTVRVTGNLISNRNVVGLLPLSDNFTIAVGGSYSGKAGKSGSGSLTACDNILDIYNAGPSTFEGSDYTCDTTDGTDLPVCKPCYPGCDESSASESAQFSETQQIASSMAEDLDLVAMAMDMEYPV